jgi:antitoxin component YwqK of YwqJK toxin-antitoxin module
MWNGVKLIINIFYQLYKMFISIYDTMPLQELEEYAYALQIPYHPPLTEDQRIYVVNDILWLKEHASEVNEGQIREQRQLLRVRRGKVCHEPKTYIGNKDTLLLSDEELVFMPEVDDYGHVLRYYCFDRFEDLDYLLTKGINPFTQKELSPDQLSFLKDAKESDYPNIEVDELPEEINNKLRKKTARYKVPRYLKLAQTLSSMVESVGLKYEAEQVLNFATNLTKKDYNLFLKHKPLNQKINLINKSRNNSAMEALNHIILYITIKEQQGIEEGNHAKIQIGIAIDEFMYMKKNDLTYEQLIEERGIVEGPGQVKELYWKPNFIVEKYHANGIIKERYYLNDENIKEGPYIAFNKSGNIKEEGQYYNDTRTGIWKLHKPDGTIDEVDVNNGGLWKEWDDDNLIAEGPIIDGKKSGLWHFWYPNGILKLEGHYDDDHRSGLWHSWYSNGMLKSEEHYNNKKRSGLWRLWGLNGKLLSEGHYNNSKKSGVWHIWDKNGNPLPDKIYN